NQSERTARLVVRRRLLDNSRSASLVTSASTMAMFIRVAMSINKSWSSLFFVLAAHFAYSLAQSQYSLDDPMYSIPPQFAVTIRNTIHGRPFANLGGEVATAVRKLG